MSADDLTTFKKLLDNAYNYEEALKRQNLKQEDVDKLREKIKYSQHVPDFITDKQVNWKLFARKRTLNLTSWSRLKLLLFLNAFKNDIDKSGKMLENFCRLKKATPEFFASRDLDSKEIQAALDHQDYVDLPVTPDNCNLIFHRLSSFEPQHYVFDEAVKTFIMTSEAYAYHHGPRSGTIFVFDLRGVRFGHLFRPGVNSVRKGIRFLEDGSPFDIKAVHIINTVPFFDMIVGECLKNLIFAAKLKKLSYRNRQAFHKIAASQQN